MLNIKTGTVLDRLLVDKRFFVLKYFYEQVEEVKSSDKSYFTKDQDMGRLYNNLYGFLYALMEMSVITAGELDTAISYLINYVSL